MEKQTNNGKLAFIVLRGGNTVNASLPYVFFGANDLAGNYASFLKDLLPPGITLKQIITDPAGGEIKIVFTDGVNADYILIEFVSIMSYVAFLADLQNLRSPKTKFTKCTLTCQDVTVTNFLDQKTELGIIDSMGLKSILRVIPNTMRESNDTLSNCVSMKLPEQEITSDYGIVGLMPVSGNAYYIGWTFDSYK